MLSDKVTKAIVKFESASRICGMGDYDPKATDAKIQKHWGMLERARAELIQEIEEDRRRLVACLSGTSEALTVLANDMEKLPGAYRPPTAMIVNLREMVALSESVLLKVGHP